jgi:hypothetical protein
VIEGIGGKIGGREMMEDVRSKMSEGIYFLP